ncbi:MAG: hypothetical protein ACI976_002747 [Aureispira sp.]|jgi:hypothetical protein
MKKITYFFALLMAVACADKTTTTEEPIVENTSIVENTEKIEALENISGSENNEAFIGAYIGMFAAVKMKEGGSTVNKINISIDKIEGGEIYGHSVVAGNDRPFKGVFDASGIKIEVKEPGDDKYDGVFVLNFDAERNKLSGTWTANDSKLKVTNRTFQLEKKNITYNKDLDLPDISWEVLYDKGFQFDGSEGEMLTEDVMAFNASNTILKKEDVENMYKGDLEVMRNAIYARHGYSFKNRKMRYIFDQIDWYSPVHTDVRSNLTDLEKKNIDLLKRYEGHASAYYDSFGR